MSGNNLTMIWILMTTIFFAYEYGSTIPIYVIDLHVSIFNNEEIYVYGCPERKFDKRDSLTGHTKSA